MRGLCLAWLLVAACDESATGVNDTDGGSGSGATDSAAGTTTGGTSGTSAASASAGSASASTTADGTGGVVVDAVDCRTLLELDPTTPSGIYTFEYLAEDVAGSTGETVMTFDAYCDMTLDGGGWTLVGRSMTEEGPYEEGIFGWWGSMGAVDDETAPYSLGAYNVGLRFSEVVVGSYVAGKEWGNAYKFGVPEDFVFLYEDAPLEVEPIPVAGDCTPDEGPANLRYLGYTRRTEGFMLEYDYWESSKGLENHGFDMDGSACEDGGWLVGVQGMIAVR